MKTQSIGGIPPAADPPPALDALRSIRWWLPFIGLGVLATRYFLWLSVEWELNPNYRFGPFVPVAALVLLLLRLDDWKTPRASTPRVKAWPLLAFGIVLILLPLVLIDEVNPDWRLLMWLEGGLLGGLGLLLLFQAGGWSWLRAGLAPLAVLALAIPWPVRFEQWLLDLLLETVSSRAADLFFLFGFEVIQHKNLLYVDGVSLGVDEACSGIQSFQLTLVITLFLSLWLPLSPSRMIGQWVGGILACLAVNLARIVVLGLIGVLGSTETLADWHDAVGALSTATLLLAILGLRWLLEPSARRGSQTASRFQQYESERARRERRLLAWPLGWSVPFLLLSTLPFAIVPLYYGKPAPAEEQPYRVAFEWEVGLPGFQEKQIPSSVTEQMRYTSAQHFSMGNDATWAVQGYEFFWEDGRISSFTTVHRPENCLPSVGYHMVGRFRPLAFRVADQVLPLERYIFEMGGRPFYVYHGFWGTADGKNALASQFLGDRLQSFRERERFGPRQAVLLLVAGNLTHTEADRFVSQLLQRAQETRLSGNEGL